MSSPPLPTPDYIVSAFNSWLLNDPTAPKFADDQAKRDAMNAWRASVRSQVPSIDLVRQLLLCGAPLVLRQTGKVCVFCNAPESDAFLPFKHAVSCVFRRLSSLVVP